MKKIVSLFLCVLLVFSATANLFVVSAETSADYFETTTNWKLDNSGATNIGGSPVAEGTWVKITSDTANVNGSEKSVKIAARNHTASIMLPNIVKNNRYTLTFDYYTTGDLTNNSAFAWYGIFAPEAANASLAYARNQLPKGFLVYKHTSNSVAEYMPIVGEKNKWCKVEMTFNSGDYDKLALTLSTLNSANSVYVDNIKLVDLDYFENPVNWKLDNSGATNIGVSPVAEGTWVKITSDAATVNGSEKSVKIAARNHIASIMLPEIQKNCDYKVTFDYYTTGDLTNNSAFAWYGIFAPEATNASLAYARNQLPKGFLVYKHTSNSVAEYMPIVGEKNKWCKVEMIFNSGNYDNLALTLATLNGANSVNIDNIKVAEVEYFEDERNWSLNDFSGTNVAPYEGAVAPTATWMSISANDDTNYTNDSKSSLKIFARNTLASIMLPEIKKNYNYTLTFDYYTTGDLANNSAFALCGIFAPEAENANINWADGYMAGKGSTLAFVSYDGSVDGRIYDYEDNTTIGAETGKWCKMTLNFDSGDFDTLAFVLQPHNGANCVYIDNVKKVENGFVERVKDGDEIAEITEFHGNSIRATGNQALRYKFSVSKDLIANGYIGYTVEKIGFLATLTSRLEGQELTKEGTYPFAEALAYDAENNTNIIFAETDTDVIYTTALFNIGFNTATNVTNYKYYGKEYTVRPYMVLKKGEHVVTVYGSAQTATVFDVMNAILEENTNEDDVNAVNTVLENEEILAAYNAYFNVE